MIKIMLVDDQPLVRQGLRMNLALEPDIQIVAEAGDGQTALDLAKRLSPDVIVMDVAMPGMDGITVTQALRSLVPGSAVVILTMNDEPHLRQRAQQAGASAFVTKSGGVKALVAAIRLSARGAATSLGG